MRKRFDRHASRIGVGQKQEEDRDGNKSLETQFEWFTFARTHGHLLSCYRSESRTIRAKTKQPIRNSDVHQSFRQDLSLSSTTANTQDRGRYRNASAEFRVDESPYC